MHMSVHTIFCPYLAVVLFEISFPPTSFASNHYLKLECSDTIVISNHYSSSVILLKIYVAVFFFYVFEDFPLKSSVEIERLNLISERSAPCYFLRFLWLI